jgi:hypothetical protein
MFYLQLIQVFVVYVVDFEIILLTYLYGRCLIYFEKNLILILNCIIVFLPLTEILTKIINHTNKETVYNPLTLTYTYR